MQHRLTVSPRAATGKAARGLAGSIPAVVYGPKQESTPISVPLHEFEALLRHGGQSALIELQGLGAPMKTLLHELDRDPVTHVPRHADFYAPEKGAKVTVSVELSFVGESPAEKAGLNVVKVLREVEIECEPTNIPTEIEVDIGALGAEGDQIHASDLKAPAGVSILTDADEVVALAQAVEEEPEEDASAEPDMDAIEVESKGKGESAEEEKE